MNLVRGVEDHEARLQRGLPLRVRQRGECQQEDADAAPRGRGAAPEEVVVVK